MLEQEGIRGVPLDVDRWLHKNPLHCASLHSALLHHTAMCFPAQQPAALRLLHSNLPHCACCMPLACIV